MKKLKKLNYLLLACLTTSVQAAGPGSDGGGNAFSSKPEDVVAVVSKLKNSILFGLVSEAQTRQLLNPKYVNDDDIKKVLSAMYGGTNGRGSGVALLEDALASNYVARKSCKANGVDNDASTAHRRNAPVCFNSTRLSRFAKDDLETEIATLTFHELAHHFGFEEASANKFQNYMRIVVKNFFQMRSIYLSGANWREMRPTGIVSIKTNNGIALIKCLEDKAGQQTIEDAIQGEDVTLIQGGDTIMKSAVSGPVMISCRKYPAIDCADFPYVDPNKEGFTVSDLQRAGVCKAD